MVWIQDDFLRLINLDRMSSIFFEDDSKWVKLVVANGEERFIIVESLGDSKAVIKYEEIKDLLMTKPNKQKQE